MMNYLLRNFWSKWQENKDKVKQMEKTIICWNCGGLLAYNSQDIRPNVWHECPDDIIAATRNPNLDIKKQK